MTTALYRAHTDHRDGPARIRRAGAATAASILPLLALALACLDGAAIHAAGQLLGLFGAGR